jgi:adenine-specific DNA-methyltransferase
MLETVIENTEKFIASVPKTKRKKYGQFFTNGTTASYMASLFCFDLPVPKENVCPNQEFFQLSQA